MFNNSQTILRFNDDVLTDILVNDYEINYQLNDIKNLNAAKTSYSQPIKIPFTPESTRILGRLFNINNASTITQQKIDAKLIQNNKVIINGYCFFDKINQDSVDIIIARSDLSLFEQIKVNNPMLLDLNFTGNSYTYSNKLLCGLTPYGYNGTGYLIDNSDYTYTGDTFDAGHTHHFIHIDWWGYANKIYSFYGLNCNLLMSYLNRLSPVIRVKTIFDKILEEQGFTYSGSSTFLQKLENMYMTTNVPVSNYTNIGETTRNTTDEFGYTKLITDNDVDYGPSDGASHHHQGTLNSYLSPIEVQGVTKNNNILSRINTDLDGYPEYLHIPSIYPFVELNTEYTITITAINKTGTVGGSGTTKFFLHPASTLRYYNDPNPDNSTDIALGEIQTIGNTFTSGSTTIKYIPKLEEISKQFGIPEPAANNNQATAYNSDNVFYGNYFLRVEFDLATFLSACTITIQKSNYLYDTGHTYTFNDLLPTNITQFDFLNNIFTKYNIYIYADNQNKKHLNFEAHDEFYSNEVLNWSNKISLNNLESSDVSREINRQITISFKEGDDAYNKYHQDTYKKILNEKVLLNSNELSNNAVENIKLSQSAIVFTTELVQPGDTFNNIINGLSTDNTYYGIASLIKSENSQVVFGFINKFQTTDFLLKYNGYYSKIYLTLSPFMLTGTSIAELQDPNTFALQFDTENQYFNSIGYSGTTITNNNLYTQFWQKDIDTKINGNQKYMKAQMRLNQNDLDIQNFRKRIWIANDKLGDSYYRLNKIVYASNPEKLSDVELLNITPYQSTAATTVNISKYAYNTVIENKSSGQGSLSGSGTGSAGMNYTGGNGIEILGNSINIKTGTTITGGTIGGPIFILGNAQHTGDVLAFSGDNPPIINWWDSMPWATTGTTGGIIVGAGLQIANGVLSSSGTTGGNVYSGGTNICVNNSTCIISVCGTVSCATTAGNALCLGGNLANTYAPLASPNFTTCTCAPIVCATTCFTGSGAGLTGTAASLTVGTATNANCLGGALANTYAPLASPTFTTQIITPLIYGSTAANGDITIRGTSDGTKTSSYVLLQDTGGNVGIGIAAPLYNLDVIGTLRACTGIMNSNNWFEKVFPAFNFPASANKAINIQFGNTSIWGYLEVEINSTYIGENSVGKLTKVFAFGTNPNNNIYTNESRVVDAMGTIPNNISIGEFAWSAATSSYVIPISHITASINDFDLKVRMFGAAGGAKTAFDNISLSGLYTLTALARNYVYYNDRVGIGTVTPQEKLDVCGVVRASGDIIAYAT